MDLYKLCLSGQPAGRPAFKAGVEECLALQCRSHSSPCFSSIQQDKFLLQLVALALPSSTFTWALVPPPPPPPNQAPLVYQQYYLGRWSLSCLPVLPPVLWGLCWLLCCSWGPCSYPCGPSDLDELNYGQPYWSSLASVAGYGRGEPGHLQSPCHPVGHKESTEFHFPSRLWMSSTPSHWPVGIGRATAGTLVSLLCLLQRYLSVGDHRPLCMSFHCRSFWWCWWSSLAHHSVSAVCRGSVGLDCQMPSQNQ